MPDHPVHRNDYRTVNFVLDVIADWVNSYRATAGAHEELGQCSSEDVRQIAKDLGVSAGELRAMSAKGPHAADLLTKMLKALSVDPETLLESDPATMRDLQRLCICCGHKGRCAHEIAAGTATEHFRSFCPNAFTLDALFASKADARN
jgi:uncharacterized protein DUF6455